MTKKEGTPKKDSEKREQHPKDQPYNPDITSENKEVLNNQSQDQKKGDYFKEREEEIDYAGSDLDLPELDEKKFNQTKNEADRSTKEKKPKESANSNDNIEAQSETVYKGKKAEKYKDPSEKSRRKE